MARKAKVRTERFRREAMTYDKAIVARRVREFYDRDRQDRQGEGGDYDLREQRYAKYRQWSEIGVDDEFSDTPLPDLFGASSHMQDILHNAVMSMTPPVTSEVPDSNHHADISRKLDSLLHQQIFKDQPGERMIADMAEDFINDGVVNAFCPWIKDFRSVNEVRWFPPIEAQALPPTEYFRTILESEFRGFAGVEPANEEAWDWRVLKDSSSEVKHISFYTAKDRRIQMVIKWRATTFDGPRPRIMNYEDVLYPVRAANLQAPSAANPNGASHLILVFRPTLGEIESDRKNGFYDLLTKEDIMKMSTASRNVADEDQQRQKDDMAGHDYVTEHTERIEDGQLPLNRELTMLFVFDVYDLDKDGTERDVLWWYCLETDTLCKAAVMTEFFPAVPPTRPVFGDSFLNVKGRHAGIGLLEMMEALHDISKMNFDQMIDAGDLTNTPFFFYKPLSNMLAEQIVLAAGRGYPLNDPKNDVHFPNLPNDAQAYRINLHTMLSQMSEELTNVGPLQKGGVPRGRASALRTSANMAAVVQAGEARPERILRRFFGVLVDIHKWTHQMNRHFLQKEKQIRMIGAAQPESDPYAKVNREDIQLDAEFGFSATMLNTNKQLVGDVLQGLAGMYINDVTLQLGIMTPDGMYRLLRDIGQVSGQNPDKYLQPPSPSAMQPKITAEEAIFMIIHGRSPVGAPMEGFEQHLQTLTEWLNADREGQHLEPTHDTTGNELPQRVLDEEAEAMYMQYVQSVGQRGQEERQRQQVIESARRQFGGQQGQQAAGGSPDSGNPPVNGGELLDETLPGAGGGGA